MNTFIPLIPLRLVLTVSVGLLLASPALAQKGKGGGGGGSSPSVLYRVIPIESTVPGPTNALGGINSSGQVCGWITGSGERFPYVWTVGSGMFQLQSLIPSMDQVTWHLETAGAINELGQIVGFMSRRDNPDSWAAYRLDLAYGARLTVLETDLIGAFAAKPGGFHTEIQINDCGDAILGANGTIYVYPATFPAEPKIDIGYRGYPYGINCSREIILSVHDDETGVGVGDARLSWNSSGGLVETLFPQSYLLQAINDGGTVSGWGPQSPPGAARFRYNDQAEDFNPNAVVTLKDGRKAVQGGGGGGVSNRMINLQGDIALSSTSGSQPYGIYTADNRYVKIPSLIHPDDAGIAPSYARMVGIAQRDLTGLPPAIVTEFLGTNEGGSLIQRGYYLLPVPAGG